MASGVRATAKLTILPCKEVKGTGKLRPNGVPFIAPYNPTNFSFEQESIVVTKPSSNGGASTTETKYTENKVLAVEFFLDGTGASPPLGIPSGSAFGAIGNAISSATGIKAINAEAGAKAVVSSVAVTAWINYFFGITANIKSPFGVKKIMDLNFATFNKDEHKPNPLKLFWGTGLFFNCELLSATVNYKLFNQLGMPLRATISAKFLEWVSTEAKQRLSPDLTKLYMVKAGDTIYNLAKQEYDDESYYIKIAEANDLKNYRRLIPGQELILPPIAKVEEE